MTDALGEMHDVARGLAVVLKYREELALCSLARGSKPPWRRYPPHLCRSSPDGQGGRSGQGPAVGRSPGLANQQQAICQYPRQPSLCGICVAGEAIDALCRVRLETAEQHDYSFASFAGPARAGSPMRAQAQGGMASTY